MLEEQKTLIKQVRDEDIEKTFVEAENFVKESEERLKNAIEARKHNDYELSHLHIERFYDKFQEIKDAMDTACSQVRALRGNNSLLTASSAKTANKVDKLVNDLDNLESMEPSEFEYLKTSNLTEEECTKLAIELLVKSTGYLQEAIKEREAGNYSSSDRLAGKSQRLSIRASSFVDLLNIRFPNTTLSPDLRAKADNYNREQREFLAKMANSASGSADIDLSTFDKLKEIDASLKKAEEVADHVDKEIGLYLKYRDREAPISSDHQSPIDEMKHESEMVKVALDGSVVPYKPGDPIAEGESTGYTYTSLAQLPSTDTGEAFNGLGGRKRRVVSSSVRVLNAQGLEVGTSFDKMYPVRELKDEAKTGEFDCPIGGSFTSQDGLCLRQKGTSTGAITAVVTNFSVGG
ncbi:MAG: hypothetical protein DBO98_04730 [Candidatus Liberibacter europaeus]|nr:hypothetical protein [Candidatus Liberibacter europaeus]